MSKYVISLDQGTTSSRAILFNHDGRIVGSDQHAFAQIYPHPGWVEHNPGDILRSQFDAVAGVVEKTGAQAGDIACVGITNQRETTLVWDRESGAPIAPAIVWQCRRTAPLCDALRAEGWEEHVSRVTGLVIDAYFSATKLAWLLDNVPGARARADAGKLVFGTVDTWLIWHLTGGQAHVTDYTNASRTMLFDIRKLCWDKEILARLNIPESMLPTVLPSSYRYGTVSEGVPGLEKLAGVPICGAAGDQQAALFGQACFEPGQAKNTYGTGCFLLMNTGGACVNSKHGLLSTIAWGLDGEVTYALEGSVFNGGSVIQWLRDELGLISSARECDELAASVPDTGGVYMVPAFTGLGAPHWDMYARGLISGLTRGTKKAHFARAALEGIAFQVADLIRVMEQDAGRPVTNLRVDGGASVSNIMMQFQADLINKTVTRPRDVETTAWGACCLAGLQAGFWNDRKELSACYAPEYTFEPQMDYARCEELLAGWQNALQRARGWIQEP